MKLVVSAKNLEHVGYLIKKKIDGIILYIDKLSVNSEFYVDVNIIDNIDFMGKEVFICINKLMHNSDLDHLREVLLFLKNKNVKILFYDMAVYNISKKLGMIDKLIIYQDHLNLSNLSNNFYYSLGIHGSYISSDITGEELLEIKRNSKMSLMFCVYGYLPIFYSRRYLIKNYLEYIGEANGKNYKIISDNGVNYLINEEEFGTTVYSNEVVNLINYLSFLDEIDYLVMNSNMTSENEFNKMVDRFIKRDRMDNCYLGFFETKTIYKVK